MKYISENLKTKRDFLLKSMKLNGLSLQYVGVEYKRDRDLVIEAVKQNGLSL
jgi:hypothetical protein